MVSPFSPIAADNDSNIASHKVKTSRRWNSRPKPSRNHRSKYSCGSTSILTNFFAKFSSNERSAFSILRNAAQIGDVGVVASS